MMRLHRSFVSLLIALGVLLLISQSVAVVGEGELGVTLRLGSVTAAGLEPGLHFKLPFAEQIATLDAGAIVLDGETENGGRAKFTSADGKTVEANYAAVWRIRDPATFCRATGCDQNAGAKRVNDALRELLGRAVSAHNLNEVLADARGALLKGLPAAANGLLKDSGVQLEAVELTALTLPGDELDAVYERMRAAELARAADIRSQGLAAADAIRADADNRKAQILGAAATRTQQIRGQAEVAAAALYQRAWRQDPAFFRFYRSLETYRRAMSGDNSVLILGPDSPLLKYVNAAVTPHR